MTSDSSTAAQPLSRHEYTCLILELVLLSLVAWSYQLDAAHRLPVALAIVTVGFAVHARIAPERRLAWFLAISVACFVLVLGAAHAAAVLVLASLVVLIVTAHVPGRVRLLLLGLLAGALLWFQSRIPGAVWAAFGSIVMFRVASYLFCVRQERAPSGGLMAWSYFLLLPNAFFLLFPVIDYTTWRQSYYSSNRPRIYQTGIHWIAVGVGELLVYRLIKNELLPEPLEIRTLGSLAVFLAMNYGLYVYVSGTFHVICGILHLFGFELPRTHDNYFLASSFTDIWRRINIYWKDFLMKVVFLPSFYSLRTRGVELAIVLAALWVFFWTWLAHAWQQFWLLGVFPLRPGEALLWGVAGAAVAVNAVVDYRKTTRPRRPDRRHPAARGAVHGLQVALVFSCVSLFWSHWTHPEVSQLMMAALLDHITSPANPAWLTISVSNIAALVGFFALAAVAGAIRSLLRDPKTNVPRRLRERFSAANSPSFDASVALHIAPLAMLLMLSQTVAMAPVGPWFSQAITGLKVERLTRGEAIAGVNGYYEQLSAGSVHAGPLLTASARGPANEIYLFSDMTRRRSDVLEFDLIPGWSGSYGGAALSINRWGMRDRDRALEKTPGTFRIAVVGSSVVMGAGVEDHQTFARLVENQLNLEHGRSGRRFEVLNFGMGKMSAIQRRALIQRRVVKFSPDLILYFAHQDERDAPLERMVTAIRNSVDLEDNCLTDLIRGLQIPPETAEVLIFAKVNEILDRVLSCTYGAIAEAGRPTGAPVAFVYLPMPSTEDTAFQPDVLLSLARKSGLMTADLSTWAEGRAAGDVLISLRDHHPNSLGHELIAARVKQLLLQGPLMSLNREE